MTLKNLLNKKDYSEGSDDDNDDDRKKQKRILGKKLPCVRHSKEKPKEIKMQNHFNEDEMEWQEVSNSKSSDSDRGD